jgi:amino acid adenylation domain-containing protein
MANFPPENRTDLARRIADLAPERQEALQKLLKQAADQTRVISRRSPSERTPLTSGQQRLWLLDQLVPGNPAYNESNFLHFPYAIDIDALRYSINAVVGRHEILRTVFSVADEEPVQQVAPEYVVEIPLRDLRQLPASGRRQEALRFAAEQSLAPFDLGVGPLLRVSLYRLDDAEYLLALTMHHMVCDGWSMGVFVVELFTIYYSRLMKRPSPLPELPIQYGDFAVWQQRSTKAQHLARQVAYWRRQLADLPTLELPTDRPRPAEFTFRGARVPLLISGPLHRALVALCEREGVTLFIMLITVFYVLLHRYSGQNDLAVGSAVAGRNRKEVEPLIGFFVNTIILRADLAGDPRLIDLLGRVRDTVFAAFANQDVAFERIVEELRPPRDKSRNPLFQVAFQFFQRPTASGVRKEVLLPFMPVPSGISKFDLSVELNWTEDEVTGHVEYNIDLFDQGRIERLIGHYDRLLAATVADPNCRISAMPLLTPTEKKALAEWNATASAYPRDQSILQVFAAVAQATPDAAAARCDGAALSFRNLDRSADHIARQLIDRGVARGDPVGLFMNRCLMLPAAVLGILKAGGAYVPLDPGYPRERLAFILADSGAKTILTTAEHAEGLGATEAQVIRIADAPVAAEPTGPIDIVANSADVACLMYTSGSTGRPKGVAVTHRNILRTVKGVRYVELSPGQSILQFSPISFDAATFEIWGALLNGCTIVLHPPGLPSLHELGAFIRDTRIDVLFLTTSLFRQMIEACPDQLRAVRQLMTGGEAMAAATARAAWTKLPRTRVSNIYGPTECTTFATIYPITNPDDFDSVVPIGRPIDNSTCYILDKYGNLVPVGVPGELYLGGDGLTEGYWRRPDLTDAAFVANPLDPATRLYRTGDIAAYRDDGNILFFGRHDRQVKLSGYRIELGEVEAALESHPDVARAAVLFTPGDAASLAAFVGLWPGRQQTPRDMRQFLTERLPFYMVPSNIELLEELPLTAAGKLDWHALARTARRSRIGGGDNAPPRCGIEKQLVELWEDLLKVQLIGTADNFFDLGGNSLAATRLLSRVRNEFQVEVTMRRFFDNPTVAGLAEMVAAEPDAT